MIHQDTRKRLVKVWIWGYIISVILFRFYIAAHDEFTAIRNDSVNYARNAAHYLDESRFSFLPPQSPGLSILARVSAAFGFPYKIVQDAVLAVASLLAFSFTRKLTGSILASLGAFSLTMLNPWYMQSSTMIMSEPLASVFLLGLVISGTYLLMSPKDKKYWALAASVSAAYVITRPEFEILYAFWFLVALLAFFIRLDQLEQGSRKARLVQAFLVFFVPVTCAVGTAEVVKQIHKWRYGVATLTSADAPGMKDLMSALYTIDPDEKIRFAPVTLQSLEKACDECPTLNLHRERLLDRKAPAFVSGKKNLDLDDEFGTWLNWHLVRSFQGVNGKSNAEMHKAAEEIRSAQKENRLSRRFAKYPLDPLWKLWLPELPASTYNRIVKSFAPVLARRTTGHHFTKRRVRDTISLGFFDVGLLRRNGIGDREHIRIFFKAPKSGYRRARIYAAEGTVLGEARVENGFGQSEFAFSFKRPEVDRLLPYKAGFYRHRDSSVPDYEFKIDKENGSQVERIDVGGGQEERWLMRISTAKPSPIRTTLREGLVKYWAYPVIGFCALSLFVGLVRGIEVGRLRPLYWFVVFSLSFLFVRCLFFAMVDVCLRWGNYRYVEPNTLFALLIAVVFSFAVGASTNRLIGPLRNHRFSRARSTAETQT